MLFATGWPRNTNEYFGTTLGKSDKVGKIYKLTKFGADRWQIGTFTWWWSNNDVVTSFYLFLFFRFLGLPTGRNFGPICTLNGSKDVWRFIHHDDLVDRFIYFHCTDRHSSFFIDSLYHCAQVLRSAWVHAVDVCNGRPKTAYRTSSAMGLRRYSIDNSDAGDRTGACNFRCWTRPMLFGRLHYLYTKHNHSVPCESAHCEATACRRNILRIPLFEN